MNFVNKLTLIAAAASLLSACHDSSGPSPAGFTGSEPAAAPGPASPVPAPASPSQAPGKAITGKVVGAAMKNPTGFAKSSKDGVDYRLSTTGDSVVPVPASFAYRNARVCIDANVNNLCDASEDFSMTGADGGFSIAGSEPGPLLAVVGTDASYADPNLMAPANVVPVPGKLLLRAGQEQVASVAGQGVVISPLSTEVLRTMEADSVAFATARETLAKRLSLNNTPAKGTDVTVDTGQVLGDLDALTDAKVRDSLLAESVALTPRYVLASKLLERGHVTDAAVDGIASLAEAEAAAFNLEGLPRYDHLFVLIFENHSNQLIDSPVNANFYKYLNTEGNKAANYISTGSPSEPNYVALGSADDWGITDDSGWNCVPEGDTANLPTDVFNPRGNCTNGTNHNIKGRRNIFSALYAAGLPSRVYSESMDPAQDPRNDGHGQETIMGTNATTMMAEPMVDGLYKTKHHPAVNFDEVRNRPDFFRNLGRTAGGGQWDAGIASYVAANKINWNVHQLEDDLASGDIGALNYIVPDQCDDIHGLTGDAVPPVPLNCDPGPAGIARGDAYAKYVVETIKASPVWKNTARKVGIVMVFDEGSYGTGAGASCCGWNAGGAATSNGPLDENITTPVANYKQGNKGDYSSIFGLVTNQAGAPKKIVDSDTYSHFSFVRTLQDIYGLADPGTPTSYMNRSKYTEQYIAANLTQLGEYQGSADSHYDAVRPMNHSYAVTTGQMGSNNMPIVRPDANQTNIWATK